MNKNRDKVHLAAILAAALLPFLTAFTAPLGRDGQDGLKPPSELALLMRQMTTFTDSTRHRLERGEDLLPWPEGFAAIHTSTPTDGKLSIERPVFDAFADHWLGQLKALYDAPARDRTDVFNATVMACANCHAMACPGPLMKIKKLYASAPEGPK